MRHHHREYNTWSFLKCNYRFIFVLFIKSAKYTCFSLFNIFFFLAKSVSREKERPASTNDLHGIPYGHGCSEFGGDLCGGVCFFKLWKAIYFLLKESWRNCHVFFSLTSICAKNKSSFNSLWPVYGKMQIHLSRCPVVNKFRAFGR